ncbi:hypothetical protein LZ32DRAFT_193351 [Colletotrichum eremochloae]|nr:hypothetical protein LZ32DRAFT_193351 [Colletotrichum eremochloae]
MSPIPFTRDPSTAHHMLRTTSAGTIAIAGVGAIARILTVLISGSSFPRGSHTDRDGLFGTSFSLALVSANSPLEPQGRRRRWISLRSINASFPLVLLHRR